MSDSLVASGLPISPGVPRNAPVGLSLFEGEIFPDVHDSGGFLSGDDRLPVFDQGAVMSLLKGRRPFFSQAVCEGGSQG